MVFPPFNIVANDGYHLEISVPAISDETATETMYIVTI